MAKLTKTFLTCGGGYLCYNEKPIVKNEESGSGGKLFPAGTVIPEETADDKIKKRVYADDTAPTGSGGSLYPNGVQVTPTKI
jgi:hypothetical protein